MPAFDLNGVRNEANRQSATQAMEESHCRHDLSVQLNTSSLERLEISLRFLFIPMCLTRNLAWAQRLNSSPDPSILEAFLANPVGLPVENADSAKSEGVDC